MTISRRTFLESTVGGVVGTLGLGFEPPVQAAEEFPVVDCHTHFYDPTRPEGIPWPGKNDKVLYRTVLPKHFLEQAKPVGVTQTVVIEASPRLEDNAWLLELASANPSVVGVVGHLEPGEPKFAAHLKLFAANKVFRGIRVGNDTVRRALERPEVLADLRRLAELDLELDVNGEPDSPADAAKLAAKLPELRIVVNHLGNISIDGRAPPRDWVEGMRAAGKQPRVFCKVSALVELAKSPDGERVPTDVDFYRPVLEATWDAFGGERLIYGSDWPVTDGRADYRTAFSIIKNYVDSRGPEAARKFFSTNAREAYRWPTPGR